MIRKDTLLAWPMIGFMVLFFLAPLLLLLGISLRGADGGWGVGNFAAFLRDPFQRDVLQEFCIAFMLVDQGYNSSRQADETLWILQDDRYGSYFSSRFSQF